MPNETEFANAFEDAHLDVERRQKKPNERRTMLMWLNDVNHTSSTRPISKIHKLINRQPKILQTIIHSDGGHTVYWD